MALMDNITSKVIAYKYHNRENYESAHQMFKEMMDSGLQLAAKTIEARKLRLLFSSITNIGKLEEKEEFLLAVWKWEDAYGQKIKNKPERGKVFSDLKRARSMLLNSLPNAFHYLNDAKIAKTTNLAEGYFSFMKTRYRDHRGLSPLKRKAFFNWFFYLKP